MSNITLYTKEACPNCNIAKLKLYRSGIEHTIVQLTNDDLVRFKTTYNKAIRSVPIIEVNGKDVYTFDQLDTVIGAHINA